MNSAAWNRALPLVWLLCACGCAGTGGVPLTLRGHVDGRAPLHMVEGGQTAPFRVPEDLALDLTGQAHLSAGFLAQARRPGILLRLAVHNRTKQRFTPLFERFLARDDAGQEMRLSAILDRRGRSSPVRTLDPGQEAIWYVRLERDQGQPFRHNLELTLHWAFALDTTEYRIASIFRAEAILTP